MLEARKSNITGFTRGSSSSQPYEEKKKNVENHKSSNDGMKELTQLIKQMEINHANQLFIIVDFHGSTPCAMKRCIIRCSFVEDFGSTGHFMPPTRSIM
jgi:hypothetical protein